MEDNERYTEKSELSEHQEMRDRGAAKEGIHRGITGKKQGEMLNCRKDHCLPHIHLAGFNGVTSESILTLYV